MTPEPRPGLSSRHTVIRGAVLLLIGAGLCLLLGSARAATTISFPDVPTHHPYAVAIEDLAQRGIVSGFPDGCFRPDQAVARQQFAKMIVLTLGIPVSEDTVCPFDDVDKSGPGSFYPDNYVAVCAQAGITLGTGPRTFSPHAPIQRCQVITMVVRAVRNLHDGLLLEPPDDYPGTWGAFDPTHAGFARIAEYNGLLATLGADAAHPAGNLAALQPYGDMPRGEVAQLLHNLLVLLDSHSSTTTCTTEPPAAEGNLLHFWWTWGTRS